MSDYISKEYITEHIKACWINGRPKHAPELHEVLSWVDEVPPEDVQPVVRCKDCYHYPNPYADCPMIGWARNEDDYCSKAERKGADE